MQTTVRINERSTPPDRLLTVDELAHRLRLSLQTTRRWIMINRVPAYRLGTEECYNEADITATFRRSA